MAFSYVAHRGNANTKTVGTTLAVTVTGTIAAGALVIARAVTDNVGASAGDTTSFSVADSQGNIYTRLAEHTQTGGSAVDGVTIGLFYSVLSTALTGSTDTITLTSANVPARAIAVEQFSTAGLDGVTAATGATGTDTAPSVTNSGLASKTYLMLGETGWEHYTTDFSAGDADYTAYATEVFGTAGGGPVANVAAAGGYRVGTLTGDTFAATLANAADWACVIVGLYEAAGAPSAQSIAPMMMHYAALRRT